MSTILVVDTEASERAALCELIHRLGYSVLEAESGTEGLGVMREDGIDLVVIDLVMSGMSEWDLLETLKDLSPSILGAVMTREIGEEGESILSSRRADGYLVKPVIPLRTERLLNALLPEEGVGAHVEVTAVDRSPPDAVSHRALPG
jgi:hypothetical protein